MAPKASAKKASFMVVCRANYFNDIRPADPLAQKTAGYAEAAGVAKAYFADGEQEAFRAYLSEAKYMADLWAAHLILEHGHPGVEGVKACLDVIERYAASPFDQALARQEQQWLQAYAQTQNVS
jgi:hypothetical protein